MNDAFISRFIVYCCTTKALYNHVGGGVSPQPPPYTLWIAYVNIISTNFLNQIYALKVE